MMNQPIDTQFLSDSEYLKPYIADHPDYVFDTDISGNTPLHIACESGFDESVRVLLDAGAEIRTENADGNLPMDLACLSGHLSVVKALIEAGHRPEWVNVWDDTPLHTVLSPGDRNEVISQARERIAMYLIDYAGAALAGMTNQGVETPAHRAAKTDFPAVIRVLGERWPDSINRGDSMGEKPIHLAAQCGMVASIEALVSLGVSVDELDRSHKSPLHHAVPGEHIEALACLLNHGADPSNRAHGCTPYEFAQILNRQRVLAFLDARQAAVTVDGDLDRAGPSPINPSL